MTMIRMRSMSGLGTVATADAGVASPAATLDPRAYSSLTPSMIREMGSRFTPAILSSMRQTTASGDPIGGSPSLSTAARADDCSCLIDRIAGGSPGMPADMVTALVQACAVNPEAVRQAAIAQGIDLDACKPWYTRKTTLIVGGIGVAALAAYFVLR